MFMLIGIAVHVTMAAIITSERPALHSMIRGHLDLTHAIHHSSKWVAELKPAQTDSGTKKEGN